MTLRLLDRVTWVALLTMAITGCTGITLLLCHATVPSWVLPAAAILALLVPRRVTFPTEPPKSRAALITGIAIVLLVTAALAYGAMATTSRHWDGAVAWDAKAARLTLQATLEQPWFRDQHVYCHSRDYPLLQPLLISLGERTLGCGRLLFPLLFVLAASVLGLALRQSCSNRTSLWACVAFAVTPNLVNPTSGAFDSGYADGMLTTTVTVALAGIVAKDRAWLLIGCLLMVLTKPEGLFYGGALVTAVWVAGRTKLLPAASIGWLLGCSLQLPLQHDLNTFGMSSAWLPTLAMTIVLAALLIGSDRWLGTSATGMRRRRWIALIGAPSILIAGPLLMLTLSDSPGTFATYLSEPGRALERITRLPEIVLGSINYAIGRGAFGLTWLLVPLLWWFSRRRAPCATSKLLGGILLLFAIIWTLPFLLSPIENLPHHLRSTLPRLLDHGTGIAWLLIALLWHRLTSNAEDEASPAADPS